MEKAKEREKEKKRNLPIPSVGETWSNVCVTRS